jgi:DNA invertase Pin-like site-specific DNA recombinase
VVAKLDRLARNVEFVFALKNSGIPIRALDLPEFNTLTVGIFASFAQFESEWVVGQFTPAISRLGSDAKRRIAMEDENNRRAMAYAKTLRTQGLSLSRISSELNVNGFKTAKNCLFSPTQVSRLLVMAERV